MRPMQHPPKVLHFVAKCCNWRHERSRTGQQRRQTHNTASPVCGPPIMKHRRYTPVMQDSTREHGVCKPAAAHGLAMAIKMQDSTREHGVCKGGDRLHPVLVVSMCPVVLAARRAQPEDGGAPTPVFSRRPRNDLYRALSPWRNRAHCDSTRPPRTSHAQQKAPVSFFCPTADHATPPEPMPRFSERPERVATDL